MKSSRRSRTDQLKRPTRYPLVVIAIASAFLIVGAITAVSMQPAKSDPVKPERVTAISERPSRNYVTLNDVGQTVIVDAQTGQYRQLTPDEAQRLADGIKQLVSQSSEGLVEVRHPDGTVSIDLQGRFQNIAVAKRNADGRIEQACIDNVESAAAFFEIDPRLFKDAGEGGRPAVDKRPTTEAVDR